MDEESTKIEWKTDEEPSSLGDWLVWLAFQAIGYSFMIAMLGLIGSMFGGIFGQGGGQWGWVAGALLAAIGYPLGWVRMENARLHKLSVAEQEQEELRPRTQMGPLKGGVVGLFIGAILGVAVGMAGVIYYLSVVLSPLAPQSWRADFALDPQSIAGPLTVALKILGWSAAGFALVFLLLGLFGRIYEMPKRDEPVEKGG